MTLISFEVSILAKSECRGEDNRLKSIFIPMPQTKSRVLGKFGLSTTVRFFFAESTHATDLIAVRKAQYHERLKELGHLRIMCVH